MVTIHSKIRPTAQKGKKGHTRRNRIVRGISYVRNLLYDENPRESHSPSSAPQPPAVIVPASGIPPSPSPQSLPASRQMFAPPSSSTSNLHDPHRSSTIVAHNSPVAAIQELEGHSGQDPHELRDSSNPEHEYFHPNSDGVPPSDNGTCLQQERQSDISPLIPQEPGFDDLTRFIHIVTPVEDKESLHVAEVQIDSGNSHANLISRELVKTLDATPSDTIPSLFVRFLHRLAPWTGSAKLAKEQARNRVRGFDGKVLSGQNGKVTLSWYGINRTDIRNPIVWFRHIRYETTFVVVDADCGAEVVLSWKEVQRLRLLDQFIGPLRRPPTPDPNEEEKYEEYERIRAEKAAARQAAREQHHGNGQSQASDTGSANQTGK